MITFFTMENFRFKLGTWSLLGFSAFFLLASVHCQKATDAFKCPQQFGYFRDGSDCNKYFICVFGDALHDKCTPGLYFNDELRMCDWPRNVKDCNSGGGGGSLSGAGSEHTGRRVYGTSTSRPRHSSSSRPSNHRNENIHSPNSIAPANPTQDTRLGSRYTPPISIGESYAMASRNISQYRPSSYGRSSSHTTVRAHSTSARPYLYSTGPPASFKPVYYRVTKPSNPTGPPANKRKVYEEDYYGDGSDYEDDESSLEEPQLMVNQHLRGGNNLYVRPISIASIRTSAAPRPTASSRPAYNSNGNTLRGPPNTRNTNTQPKVSYSSFDNRGQSRPSSYDSSEENDRSSYTRNIIRPAAPTHGSNVRTRTSNSNSNNNRNSALSSTYTSDPRNTDSLIRLRPQVSNDRGIQSLDNGGDSLDAQFGTNPRAISLPDRPYRNPNSFESNSELRKAERNQHHQQYSKPKVSSTRFSAPARPAYKTEDSSEDTYEEYPEYYYDEDDYEDDDDVQNISPVPKVVIRLQKPTSTTRKTTTTTTTTTTTRRPTTTTTRRPIPPATTKPPKRALPFGISRPATKPHFKVGPKQPPKPPSRPDPVYATPRPLTLAENCSSRHCVLPDCHCASADIPGKIPARETPQIVLITFDDAVNDLNYELYAELFDTRKNPNGCPILGTFYVSHEWTDYGMVQSLYAKGHEMASHSITHSHGEKFSVNRWTQEIAGQREILHLYGGVKLEDIRGMRAPFLQVGGNNMFESLYLNNFTYDSSMPVLNNNPPYYPYTLDYNIGHECMIPPCPTKSFPGLWEVGMVMWNDYRGGRCSMGDACANPDNAEDVFKMLLQNFERHYNSNRAPFGLYYHAAWFTTQHYRKGYMKFIDYINSKDDVYMVTNWQALQWMRDPTPLSRIQSFKPWQCPKDHDKPSPCHHPKACNLNYKGGSRSFKTCQPCPSVFPWTGRTGFDEVYAV